MIFIRNEYVFYRMIIVLWRFSCGCNPVLNGLIFHRMTMTPI